ncbi:MBOAT family O-acyltransferase [Crocosphaera sp. Alani8]|uniref:MBOAT family O-acyltransferase n=1 Tax=Crocosphaera sp. Alani8 TaxID=3038952 RepID=UPI00313E6570
MLFNSYVFIFLFLPITLLGFYGLGTWGSRQLALIWLVVASLFFYSWWNINYLGLFCFSMFLNFFLGSALAGEIEIPLKKIWLLRLGITLNLGVLVYFKYADLTILSLNSLINTNFPLLRVFLPLAISFFTFQQIAYLVDVYRGKVKENSFANYCLFISFFPQLIAGPIVYYRELIPQFERQKSFRLNPENVLVGVTMFSMGLFKKTVLADNIAPIATKVFNTAVFNQPLTCAEAWVGAIAFALQLYFDFSGYTDMAIGAARTFGIRLPINFNSPYKSVKISQLWRNWHMTLTRFMREYVFFPLSRYLQNLALSSKTVSMNAGNTNLVTTTSTLIVMLLIGIWHGAGWNYLIWGAINGVYLIGYQQWRELRRRLGHNLNHRTWWSDLLGWCVTFFLWCVALVWAKADSMQEATNVWGGMFAGGGFVLPNFAQGQMWSDVLFPTTQLKLIRVLFWLGLLLAIAVLTPNTQQWLEKYQPALDHYPIPTPKNWYQRFWLKQRWQITPYWAVISAILTLIAILSVGRQQEFIYFQF